MIADSARPDMTRRAGRAGEAGSPEPELEPPPARSETRYRKVATTLQRIRSRPTQGSVGASESTDDKNILRGFDIRTAGVAKRRRRCGSCDAYHRTVWSYCLLLGHSIT
jgi:hypothetical protein